MKDLFFPSVNSMILISVLAVGVPAQAGQHHCPNSSDEQALRGVAERWKQAYNQGDAEGVAALYDKDAFYLTQHFVTGILHGREQIKAYVQRGVDAKYRVESIQLMEIVCAGGFAYTVGSYASTNAGQKALGVNLVVLRKHHGKWRIVAHEAAVPDPATAIRQLHATLP
jgi:uncharacterized protein (TIGR02246 family)